MNISENAGDPPLSGTTSYRRVEASELRSMAPFVVIDAIEPGDVLLTRGVGKESKIIASATSRDTSLLDLLVRWAINRIPSLKNQYSHAAIWLPVGIPDPDGIYRGRPSTTLAESDDFGVGFSRLSWITLHTEGSKVIAIAQIPSGTVHSMILRHPEVKTLPRQFLLEASANLIKTEFYKDYSEFERLIRATDLPPMLKKIASLYLRRKDKQRPRLSRGVFCSELVGVFFGLVQLKLFDSGRTPEFTSPNDLSDNVDCKLQRVDGGSLKVILYEEDIPDDAYGTFITNKTESRGRSDLAPMIKHKSDNEHTLNLANDLLKTMKDMDDESAKTLFKMAIIRLSACISEFKRALLLKDNKAAQKFSLLIQDATLSIELLHEYDEWRTKDFHAEEGGTEERFVEWHLFKMTDRMGSKIEIEMTRSAMLMTFRLARSIENDRSKPKKEIKNARKLRRKLLKGLIRQKSMDDDTKNFINEIKQSVQFDEEKERKQTPKLYNSIEKAICRTHNRVNQQ